MPTVENFLRNFVSSLNSELDTHELEQVLSGDQTLTSIDVGNQPEPGVE